jgi:hypothetical protein
MRDKTVQADIDEAAAAGFGARRGRKISFGDDVAG